ncbi:hypothetical protein B0T21DRAFT_256181, partial [Apiosordaria backusii]
VDSPKSTPQQTLTLPNAPQNPPTPVQQQSLDVDTNTNTNNAIYDAAQQDWMNNDNSTTYFADYPLAGLDGLQAQAPMDFSQYQMPASCQTLPALSQDLPFSSSQTQLTTSQSPVKENKARTLSQKLLQGKVIIHDRTHKYKGDNPANVYENPPSVRPWGPLLKKTRVPEHTFEYVNNFVELMPQKRFSKDELITFMKGTDCPNAQRKLTLWIQNTPAQVNQRYVMAGNSGKCRYKHCPGKFTIWKGFFRVAFDEFSNQTGTTLDPFHNAGYMHLHCFEKLFDLAYLIHYGAAQYGFTIQSEVRNFPFESRNPMSLTRDHHEMAGAYFEWLQQQKPRCDLLWLQQGPGSRAFYDGFTVPAPPSHHKTLGYKLTTSHLAREIVGREATREERGGANIGIHKGNLELFMHLKSKMKNPSKSLKRRSRDDDDEEEQDTITYNPRPTKRARAPRVPSINTSVNTSITNPTVFDDSDVLPAYNPLDFMDYQADFASNSITNQQINIPSQLSPGLQSPGPRTRQRSREMSVSLVGFLNSRNHLTRTQAQEIGARLADEPSHVQDNVLSGVQPEVANILLRDGISPVVETKIKKLNKRQLKDLEQVIERVEKNGDMRRVSSMW